MKTRWLLTMCLVAFASSQMTKLLSLEEEEVIPGLHSGLRFQPKGSMMLATGAWTAVIRFEEEEIARQARELREQFNRISQALAELKQLQGNAPQAEERTRGETFLKQRLSTWEREKSWMLTEVRAAEQEMRELRTELPLSRRARGLIPFIGDGLNPRPAGGGAFERPPPLRFFEDSEKTAARSAAGFSPTLPPIFSATFVKISTQCHVRSGHQVRSSDPTTK